MDRVNDNYLLSEKPHEIGYKRLRDKIEQEIYELNSKIENASGDVSNHHIYVEKAIDFLQNLSNNWHFADLNTKLKI